MYPPCCDCGPLSKSNINLPRNSLCIGEESLLSATSHAKMKETVSLGSFMGLKDTIKSRK